MARRMHYKAPQAFASSLQAMAQADGSRTYSLRSCAVNSEPRRLQENQWAKAAECRRLLVEAAGGEEAYELLRLVEAGECDAAELARSHGCHRSTILRRVRRIKDRIRSTYPLTDCPFLGDGCAGVRQCNNGPQG